MARVQGPCSSGMPYSFMRQRIHHCFCLRLEGQFLVFDFGTDFFLTTSSGSSSLACSRTLGRLPTCGRASEGDVSLQPINQTRKGRSETLLVLLQCLATADRGLLLMKLPQSQGVSTPWQSKYTPRFLPETGDSLIPSSPAILEETVVEIKKCPGGDLVPRG